MLPQLLSYKLCSIVSIFIHSYHGHLIVLSVTTSVGGVHTVCAVTSHKKKNTAEQGSRSKVVTRVVSGVLFAQTCLFCDVTRNINLDNQSCHTGTDHIPVSVLVSYQYFYSKAFVPHLLLSHDYRKGSKISLLTKMVK